MLYNISMKKIILASLLSALILAGGVFVASRSNAQSAPVGTLKFTDTSGAIVSTVTRSAPDYSIAADNAPAGSVALHIEYWRDSEAHKTSSDSSWANVGASGTLRLSRTLNCDNDSVWGGAINGHTLTQDIYLGYSDGSSSPHATLVKDCTGGSGSGGTVMGKFVYSAEPIKKGQFFHFYLSNVNTATIPDSTVSHLYVNNGEGACAGITDITSSCFNDYDNWLTVGDLKNGEDRTMNCDAYTSYTPGAAVNVNGKILNQQIYVSYVGTGIRSDVTASTKDCSTDSVSNVHITTSGAGAGLFGWQIKQLTSVYSSFPDNQTDYALDPGSYALLPGGTGPYGDLSVTVNGSPVAPEQGIFFGNHYPFPVGSSGEVNININVNLPPAPQLRHVYSISPSIATVAVGETISLKGYDSVEGGDPQDVTSQDRLKADRFYLTPGPTPGTFIGANPGKATVRLGDDLLWHEVAEAVITVTGSPAQTTSTSAKVKITESRDITKTLFPVPYCRPDGWNCGAGAWTNLHIVPGDDGSRLLADDFIMNSTAGFGPPPPISPKLYSLANDPLKPSLINPVSNYMTIMGSVGYGFDIGSSNHYINFTNNGIVASKDGKYYAGATREGVLDVWHNGRITQVGKNRPFNAQLYGIVDYNDQVILLGNNFVYNITDIETTAIPSPYGDSWPRANQSLLTTKLPPGSSNFIDGGFQKLIMDNDYIASVSSYTTPNKLQIFKIGRTSVVASIDLAPGVGGALVNQSGPGGQYIFMVNGGYNYGNQEFSKIYGFKFNGTTLTKVIDGLTLDKGIAAGVSGIKVGNDIGVILSMRGLGTNQGGNVSFDASGSKVRVYLLSDLLSGSVKDVMANSPVGMPGATKMAAMEKDGVAYLYFSTIPSMSGSVYVWKIESIDPVTQICGSPVATLPGSCPAGSVCVQGTDEKYSCQVAQSCGSPIRTQPGSCPSGQSCQLFSGGTYDCVGALANLSCSANPASIAQSGSTTFTATGGSGTYTWTGGGTPATSTGATFQTSYSAAGSKTAQVNDGSNTASCNVTVEAPVGSCDFNIAVIPVGQSDITVSKTDSSATVNFSTTKPAGTTCGAMTVDVQTVYVGSSRIIYPSISSLTISPGSNGVALLNLSAPSVGTYPLTLTAYLGSVKKTMTVYIVVR